MKKSNDFIERVGKLGSKDVSRRFEFKPDALKTPLWRFIIREDSCVRRVSRLGHPLSQVLGDANSISSPSEFLQCVQLAHSIWNAARHPGNQLVTVFHEHTCRGWFDDAAQYWFNGGAFFVGPVIVDCCSVARLQAFNVDLVVCPGEKQEFCLVLIHPISPNLKLSTLVLCLMLLVYR